MKALIVFALLGCVGTFSSGSDDEARGRVCMDPWPLPMPEAMPEMEGP